MENKELRKQRIFTVTGIALALFLGALDQTIVSTAMPRIVADLQGVSRYTWVTTVYLIVSTLLVPLYGRLSDSLQRKSMEIFSILVFLAGSALCGMAGEFAVLGFLGDGMTQLIIFRGVQAVGGAGLFALAFIIISDLYPPRERGKISGILGGVFGLASIFGPLAGGYLTDHAGTWINGIAGWRWVFYVNVPFGALALWFISVRMPRIEPKSKSRSIDYFSSLFMVLGFFALILALQLDKNIHPWSSPLILGLFGGAVVLLVLWVFRSLRNPHPVLDLNLFKNKVFYRGIASLFFFGAAFMSVIIFLPLYMVNVQGVSATRAGVSIIPLSAGVVLGAGLAGPLSSRLGRYKGILVVGAVGALTASILMATLSASTPYWLVVVFMIIAGLGFGPSQSLYSLAVQNAVTNDEIGQATSFSQFSRQIGSAIGTAILGTVFTVALAGAFETHMPSSAGSGDSGMSAPVSRAAPGSTGPTEMKQAISSRFDILENQVTQLFNARGNDAGKMLDDLLSGDSVPKEYRNQLSRGTPAMQIEAEFSEFEKKIDNLIREGDTEGLEKMLGSPPGNSFDIPQEALAGMIALTKAPEPAREAALLELHARFEGQMQKAEDAASAAALQGVLSGLKTGRQKALSAVEQVRLSFADAVHRVWLYAIAFAALLLVMTIILPGLKLRERGESVEGGLDGGP